MVSRNASDRSLALIRLNSDGDRIMGYDVVNWRFGGTAVAEGEFMVVGKFDVETEKLEM